MTRLVKTPAPRKTTFRKNRQPEFALACAVADLIRRTVNPGVFWTAIENGERRPLSAVERCKRKGVRNGVSDLIFCIPDKDGRGLFYGLELKTAADKARRIAKGVVSDDQRAVAQQIYDAGGQYAVAFGWDEAVRYLTDWGVIKPDRSLVRASEMEDAA